MDAHDRSALIALAWADDASPSARRRLTVGEVVDAGIALADAGGLAACSMPRLSTHLGVGTMSLYRYVPSKEVLVALMVDRATEPVPDEAAPNDDWREALTAYAMAGTARFARHPWMLDVAVSGFPQGPNQLAWLESGLAAMHLAGFDEQQSLGAMLLVDGHVTATARLARGAGGDAARSSEPPAEHLDAARFPRLRHLLDSGALAAEDDDDFGLRFGLDRVLAGIEALANR